MFKKIKIILVSLLLITSGVFCGSVVYADAGDRGLSMSPLNQVMVLFPGETYNGSFNISNPESNDTDFAYVVSVKPFFVDEEYHIYYEETDNLNQIVDWITVGNSEGLLKPNQSTVIDFTIDVPDDIPSGGQYAAITVYSKEADNAAGEDMGIQINQTIGMAYIIYAELAGTTERHGDILDVDVSSFLFSGSIHGSATIKNTGNVHSQATYTMQVFPLFSGEEVFTNEEKPETDLILPGRALYHETKWDDTPWFGIFNVVYKVEFEGVTTEVNKMVIVCPVWLLFIIIFVVFALIFYFVAKAKARKKAAKKAEKTA